MADLTLESLDQLSFKGAVFLLLDSVKTEGGKKTVTHEFLNTERRFEEDLGGLQRTYRLRGIINNPNYYEKREALLNALEQPGPGIFTHPTQGSIQVMAKPYVLDESTKHLGYAFIDLVFSETDQEIFPQESGANTLLASSTADTVASAILSDLETELTIDVEQPLVLETAIQDSDSFINEIDSVSDSIQTNTENIPAFDSAVNNFSDNLSTSLLNLPTYADNMAQVFTTFREIGSSSLQQYNGFKSLFSFGDLFTSILPTTVPRQNRANNREVIKKTVQATSLVYAYSSILEFTFTTIEELEEVSSELEAQYQKIISNFTISNSSLDQLKELRVLVRDYFDSLNSNLSQLTTVETFRNSARTLSYQYYGTTDNAEEIIDLNAIVNPALINGDITILQ